MEGLSIQWCDLITLAAVLRRDWGKPRADSGRPSRKLLQNSIQQIMVVWNRVVMVEVGKDEAQRLSSIQFIISVSSSQILALDNLSRFPSFSSFSVFMVVRYHFELAIVLKPQFYLIMILYWISLKHCRCLVNSNSECVLKSLNRMRWIIFIFTCLCFQNHISIIIALFFPMFTIYITH